MDGGGPNDPGMDQTRKAKIGDYFMQFTENLSKQGTQHTLSHFFFLSVTSQGASVVHNVPQFAGKGPEVLEIKSRALDVESGVLWYLGGS